MAISPLFDIYDPTGAIRQRAMLSPFDDEEDLEITGAFPVKRRPQITDLMPEEEKQSMLRSLANVGASGLSGLGWLLDIPGSAVRGTISGIAEGDPLKGLRTAFASSDERVSGRDLLRQFGLADKQDGWLNFGAGLATEVLTDPLSLLNPAAMLGRGAYGTAGRAAERAGLLENFKLLAKSKGMGPRQFLRENTPRTLAAMSDDPRAMEKFATAAAGKKLNVDDLLDQPLAGVMEARIPGMERGALISGGAAGDSLAKALDLLGETAATNRFTAPVVNRATAFFDPTVMGEVNYDKQWRNRKAYAGATKNMRESREWLAERQIAANQATHNDFTFSNPRIQNAIRDTIEAKMDPERVSKLLDQEAVSALEAVPEWKTFRDDMADRLAQSREQARANGMDIPVAQSLEDTGFFPAQAIGFNRPDQVVMPERLARRQSAYNKGSRVLNTDDLVGRSRNPYTDLDRRSETFRRLMAGEDGRKLQERLFGATDEQVPGIIDDAFAALGMESPYSKVVAETVSDNGHTVESLTEFLKDPTLLPSDRKEWGGRLESLAKKQEAANAAAKAQRDALKLQLGDLISQSDRQFSKRGVGLFDNAAVNDMERYLMGRAVSDANAPVVLEDLLQNAVPMASSQVPGRGVKPLMEAAAELGFDKNALAEVLQKRGINNPELMSVGEATLENLKKLAPAQRVAERGPGGRLWDSFTNLFKIGALANPAYHTRNLYSGFLSTLTGGGGNPISNALDSYAGFQAGKGNYGPALNRLRNTVYARGLVDDDAGLRDKFLAEASRNRLGSGVVFEGDTPVEQAMRNLYPGGDKSAPVPFVGDKGLLYDPNRTWMDWLTTRGVDFGGTIGDRPPPSETLNPLFDLHERTARRVEDANRLGAYIGQLRQGASPDQAANFAFKTQADYSRRAFGAGEQALKQYVPFYSYPRQMLPLVVENILQRPGGVQGQITRAISRAAEPSEENFLPDYIRKGAAIPIPGAPREGLQRVLTNIDVPWSFVNLITPGKGNTLSQVVGDTLQQTGMNLLGQLNPAIKGPLELILNRQLYSGRELSDLYSVLEKDIGPWGRLGEQVLVNMPGGSKINAIYRTARDKRLTPAQKALKLLVNNTSGVSITDVDEDKAMRKAARDTLNELLATTPGVRTYENITVPEDVLRSMPKQQQDMYLLYKIIQSEAAKRARDKKKQQTAIDPLELLGVVQNQGLPG